MMVRTVCPGFDRSAVRMSLAWTTPAISSRLSVYTGYRERRATATSSAAASTERSASRATIWVRGVMTSWAVFSLNSKTPSSRRASCLSRLPPSSLCSTSIRISSGECSRSCSPGGLMPMRWSSQLADPLSSAIGHCMTQAKPISGAATHVLTTSGWISASALGTSSPRMMWRTVMMMKAMAEATPWVAMVASDDGSQEKPLRMRPARAGSPIHPRPSDASVIPSWVAEM